MKMKSLILEEIQKLKKKREIKKEKEIILQEDSVSSKSSHSQISVKSQSTAIRSGMDLFLGFSFCFPLVDIELSPKRITIISKTIEAERGIVVKYEDKIVSQPIDFILVSPAAKIQPLLKKLGNKLKFQKILDFNFILNSIRQGLLLSIDKYSLYNSKPENVGEQLKNIYVSKTAKKYQKLEDDRKIVHLGNNQWNKHEQNTDSQLRQEQFEVDQILSTKSCRDKPIKAIQFCKQLANGQQKKQKSQINKDLFLCQISITSQSMQKFSMNKFICEQLMKLQNIYQSEKDIGRKIAYLKAVSVIKSLPFEIENELDLQNVKGIGTSIIAKIQQLINTGKMQKLERFQQNQKNIVQANLCKIWGVGPSKAQQLYKDGIKSVQQLRKQTNLLNKSQLLGLKYYEDFLQKIPREKITAIFSFIKDAFKQIVENSNNYHIQVCGSYRRGKPLSGDIDIIISRKDGLYEKKLLLDLVLLLEKKQLLIDHLQLPSSLGKGSQSYMGVCRFQSDVHHRIDIKYYPIQQYPYALLYFTGSDMFNRSMRLYARKVGLHLSDHGAQPKRDEKSGAIWEKPVPPCADQRSIFEFMGLDYRCPRQRQA